MPTEPSPGPAAGQTSPKGLVPWLCRGTPTFYNPIRLPYGAETVSRGRWKEGKPRRDFPREETQPGRESHRPEWVGGLRPSRLPSGRGALATGTGASPSTVGLHGEAPRGLISPGEREGEHKLEPGGLPEGYPQVPEPPGESKQLPTGQGAGSTGSPLARPNYPLYIPKIPTSPSPLPPASLTAGAAAPGPARPRPRRRFRVGAPHPLLCHASPETTPSRAR